MELKEAFWELFLGLAASDGRYASKEFEFLEGFFEDRYGIDLREKESLKAQMMELRRKGEFLEYFDEAIRRIRAGLPRKDWKEIVKMLSLFAMVDESVDIDEIIYLGYVADKLGVDIKEVAQEVLKEMSKSEEKKDGR